MNKFYIFYFILIVISALIISITLILDSAVKTLENEKRKLIAEFQTLEKYIYEAKKIEDILKKVKLQNYEKNKANHILLTFLENLRINYNSQIKNIIEKKNLIEAKVEIKIDFSKEKLKELIFLLTKSTNPVVYIEEFTLTDGERFIKIKVYQPYMELYNDT